MIAADTEFDQLPKIIFTRDWNHVLIGELMPGRVLSIAYDAARLPEIRDTYQGLPAWGLTAFAQFHPPDGPVTALGLEPGQGGMFGRTLQIPEDAEEVVLWFANSGRSGRVCYDSQYSQNYRFRFPRRDVRVVTAQLSGEGDDEYGGLTVAIETPAAVSNVGLEYSIPSGAGPYPPQGCICLEVTGEEDGRKRWSISEYMVPAREGVEFAVYYQIGGHRFRDDNGGRGYQALAPAPAE